MPFKKSNSQCPLGFFWRGDSMISKMIGILLSFALIGLIFKIVIGIFQLSFFAIKWLIILGLIYFSWQKAKFFYWSIKQKWQNRKNLPSDSQEGPYSPV